MAGTVSASLQGKRAVVFGAAGSIGGAVAREFGSAGAEVFLSGRTFSGVDAVAKEINAGGGIAHAAAVDALDERSVEEYIASVVHQVGRVDIEFNATGPRINEYENGRFAVDVSLKSFMLPVETVLQSQFITARAAARHMLEQRSGVIIFLTGSPSKPHIPGSAPIGAAFGAVENLTRQMALELGPAVRVVCVRTAANTDSRVIRETLEFMAPMMKLTTEQAIAILDEGTFLKVSPKTTDTARAAAFLASDQAHMMTGTVLNSSAGVTPD